MTLVPPLVIYTALHEKILICLNCLLSSKEIKNLIYCIFGIAAASCLAILPVVALMIQGDKYSILHIWLPVVLTLLVLAVVVPIIFFSPKSWETLDSVNNDFYEKALLTDSAPTFYKPRRIQEMKYSQGVWRSASNNLCMKFRGVNLPAKIPSYGHQPDIFYSQKKHVSFIDMPFPLNTARQHFQRLSNYGFNLLRLNVTWEAVMHEGPGIIDKEYLNYLSSLLDMAAESGLYVIIDPHQDVWSRFTGGDGAPWWTLDAAGFVTEDDTLHESGSAFLDHLHDTENYPPAKMAWVTNYGKLAAATMFTLFFAGDTYAPGIHVDEHYSNCYHDDGKGNGNGIGHGTNRVSMQKFLQKFYLQFIDAVAQKVKDKPNVIGFNTMNEPSNGYVGVDDLRIRITPAPFGISHSYFDGMRMGCGETIKCQFFSAPFKLHSIKTMNPQQKIAWKSPDHDIWQKLGVYDINDDTGEVTLQKPSYFSLKEKDFMEEHMVSLFEKIQSTISRYNYKFIVYAEPFIDVNNHKCLNAPNALDGDKYAWAPHWYDGATLFFREYFELFALDDERKMPVITPRFIDAAFKRILGHLHKTGNLKLHVLLGETGVPFDIDDTNNYAASTKALDRIMRAIEANNLDFTLWNYFPDNTKEEGDKWCGEDLSVRMVTQNRALLTLVRPFAYEISCDFQIVKQTFDPSKKTKTYELILKPLRIEHFSCYFIYIYLPHFHFSNPLTTATVGSCKSFDKSSQLLVWDCTEVKNSNLLLEFALKVENALVFRN